MNWIKDLKNFDREFFLLNPDLKDQAELDPENFLVQRRRMLIVEEYKELLETFATRNKRHLAKELADLIYVCIGTATTLDIDLERVFKDVHNSNMSKFGYDAKMRDDGKILKSESFQDVDLSYIKEEF